MRELVDAALAEVYGYTATVELSSYLTGPVAPDGMTLPVADASRFSRGVVEIGSELLLVDSVDRQGNTLTVPPGGRGIRSTGATEHAVGDRVVFAPTVPRVMAERAVRDALLGVRGMLYGQSEVQFPSDPVVRTYDLPPTAQDIQHVAWLEVGPDREWVPVRRWRMDAHANPPTISIYDGIVSGQPVRVSFTTEPLVPDMSTGSFADTGLPDTSIEVIRLGAAWRMTTFMEPFNLLAQSAEADAMDRQQTPQSRLTVSKHLYQLYSARLEDEVNRMNDRRPVRVHFTY